jgi:methylthioribose-1-phosphate isomerase
VAVSDPRQQLAETPTIETIAWAEGKLRILDQTRLPREETYLELADYRQVAEAIGSLRVRGAPAIGVAAAYGLALAARADTSSRKEDLLRELRRAADALSATRPTAVNLSWALARALAAAERAPDVPAARDAILEEAQRIQEEDVEANRRIGRFGAELLPGDGSVLTHCNTGSLATAGRGTALGVVRTAHEQGKALHVYATETRPLLQGARLTAWELLRSGIPATLIPDSAAGHFLKQGRIECVIVGADRIAANGDVANKVGTYTLAVLAHENGVPFYVAAPTSTIDLALASGDEIPIEERPAEEVTRFADVVVAPEGTRAANPAFDVTPHRYVTAIITDRGVVREPYDKNLAALGG